MKRGKKKLIWGLGITVAVFVVGGGHYVMLNAAGTDAGEETKGGILSMMQGIGDFFAGLADQNSPAASPEEQTGADTDTAIPEAAEEENENVWAEDYEILDEMITEADDFYLNDIYEDWTVTDDSWVQVVNEVDAVYGGETAWEESSEAWTEDAELPEEDPVYENAVTGEWRVQTDWFTYSLLDDDTLKIIGPAGRKFRKLENEGRAWTLINEISGYPVSAIGRHAFGIRPVDFKNGSLRIPDSITTVEENPFVHLDNVSSIIVSMDHPTLAVIDNVLFSKQDKRLIRNFDPSKEEYSIPDGIRVLENRAFFRDDVYGSAKINRILIPDTVTTVNGNPFLSSRVSDIVVSQDHPVLAVIDGALYNKIEKKLIHYFGDRQGSLVIPEGILTIGTDSCFDTLFGSGTVTIPDSVNKIEAGAFAENGFKEITLPEKLTSIGEAAFFDCWNLQSINIPSGVTRIEPFTFLGCDFSSLTLPDSITEIGDYAFFRCWNLSDINIPDGVTKIGQDAFANTALTTVTIPDSVTEIGENAFKDCNQLTSVYVGRSSYAKQYCVEHNLPYVYTDLYDWLKS